MGQKGREEDLDLCLIDGSIVDIGSQGDLVTDPEIEIDGVVDGILAELTQKRRVDAPALFGLVDVRVPHPAARPHRERAVDVMIVVQGQADLLEVVDALHPTGRLAHGLDGRQQQGDQHGDDRDDDQQLDQRKPETIAVCSFVHDFPPRSHRVQRHRPRLDSVVKAMMVSQKTNIDLVLSFRPEIIKADRICQD